jgi:NADH-quinone oxidoreductase subunit F
MEMEKVLLRNIDDPHSATLQGYQRSGGYSSLKKALDMEPKAIIEEVKKSGLRGRGGAGFPTGMKWDFAARDPKFPKILICNADEGEPGTFKDRPILEKNPHLLMEGMIVSAYALQSERGYIYLRGEYPFAKNVLEKAIEEAYREGYLGENIDGKGFTFHLSVHQGAGAYICGEETALIDSLEGRRGQPRIKPPFPVNYGAWGQPTVVNNVETLSNIPYIIDVGGEAYAKIGSDQCPGPKLFSVSCCVEKPGVYELPMGTPLREIIYDHAGGVRGGRQLKAVIPGGISTPVLTPDKIDCSMDFVSLPQCGSMLGSGAVMVFDDSVCMVKVCWRAMKFYEHESCGKCTPCREGTGWMRNIVERIENGLGREGDIELFQDVAVSITGKTFCPLGDGAANVAVGFVRNFASEFDYHIKNGRCLTGSVNG